MCHSCCDGIYIYTIIQAVKDLRFNSLSVKKAFFILQGIEHREMSNCPTYKGIDTTLYAQHNNTLEGMIKS